MNNQPEITAAVEKAVSGDRRALEELLTGIQDPVFHLSLRMLGTVPDAEDAAQEILLKVMTHLSSFRGESAFTTWVFRIAVNHLKDYKKHMFANRPLSFEFYGADIDSGKERDLPALSPELDILSHRLALIPTGGEYEVLTHEFKCQSADGRHVLVYINAQTGQEEKILILLEDESGTLVI